MDQTEIEVSRMLLMLGPERLSTKPQKWKKYGIVSGTFGMIVLIAVCSWWFLIRQVIIPDVEGMTVLKAEQRLHQQNLRIGKITRVNSQAVDKTRLLTNTYAISFSG